MADLGVVEKLHLEKLLGMSGGYVLQFSNRSFAEFVAGSVHKDIYCGDYDYQSNSKANLLRRFWEVEPNHVVGKLLADLLSYIEEVDVGSASNDLSDKAQRIADRLLDGAPVEDISVIEAELEGQGFDLLMRSIRDSLGKNEPESGLDRLHTFMTKFMRHHCRKYGVDVPKDKPLHSLMGEYIKKKKDAGALETEMTERILKNRALAQLLSARSGFGAETEG
jgi:hypothetical protein